MGNGDSIGIATGSIEQTAHDPFVNRARDLGVLFRFRAERAMVRVQLMSAGGHFGLESESGEGGSHFSGGNSQAPLTGDTSLFGQLSTVLPSHLLGYHRALLGSQTFDHLDQETGQQIESPHRKLEVDFFVSGLVALGRSARSRTGTFATSLVGYGQVTLAHQAVEVVAGDIGMNAEGSCELGGGYGLLGA